MAIDREMEEMEMQGEGERSIDVQVKETGRRGFGDRKDEVLEGARRRLAQGMEQAGEKAEERARRLEEQGGMQGRAGQALHRVGDQLEQGAEYLRSRELSAMPGDLTRTVRQHPYAAVCVAVGTGFVIGRVLGGIGLFGRGRRSRRAEARERRSERRERAAQALCEEREGSARSAAKPSRMKQLGAVLAKGAGTAAVKSIQSRFRA